MVNIFLSNFLNLIIFSLICKSFFNLKINKHLYWLLCLLIVTVKSFLFSFDIYQFNYFITLFSYFLILKYFYNGSVSHQIIFLFTFSICNILSELLIMKIVSLIFPNTNIFNTNTYVRLFCIILNNIFVLLISKTISYYFHTITSVTLPNNFWIFFAFPITTLVLILGVNNYYKLTYGSGFFVVILFGLLVSNLVYIYIFNFALNQLIKENKIQQEAKETKLKLEIAKKTIKQHDIFQHNIRKQSIDMISLLENNKLVELKDYINNCYSESIRIYNMIHTNCEILDMLINDRIFILQNNKIKIDALLENHIFYNINTNELEYLLSYFLDLCIHEIITNEQNVRSINIRSKIIEKMTILSFSFYSNYSTLDILKEKIYIDMNRFFLEHQLNFSVFSTPDISSITISIIFNN